jgi:hypothetical protein
METLKNGFLLMLIFCNSFFFNKNIKGFFSLVRIVYSGRSSSSISLCFLYSKLCVIVFTWKWVNIIFVKEDIIKVELIEKEWNFSLKDTFMLV